MNQVELWFAKIQPDVIVFTSVADLGNKLVMQLTDHREHGLLAGAGELTSTTSSTRPAIAGHRLGLR